MRPTAWRPSTGVAAAVQNFCLMPPVAVTARVARVLEASCRAGLRVFFTRHMSLPKEPTGGEFQYRMSMAGRVDDPTKVQPCFLRDLPGFAIAPELTPRPSEAIFDKLAMSGFEGAPLAFVPCDRGIAAVAVAGITMEIGMEPTARHAPARRCALLATPS